MNGADFTKELERREETLLAPYALNSAKRREELGPSVFREHEEKSRLEYRTEYHRDRDRIIWSRAFRRLQNKTQVFPHYVEDHYRRRLTHSLEVAQIATTLARALRANEVATEAIALAHDIGHAPFGRGGEQKLDELLKAQIPEGCTWKSTKVPLYGFDHCSHSLEVVSRIEKDYESYCGLNLTFDVRDGILKHIFEKGTKESGRIFSYLENVTCLEKYKEFKRNNGSIEAQCVWLADKLAYLFSDLEDGLRCKIFEYAEISGDAFVGILREEFHRRRGPAGKFEIDDMDGFLSFRRNALAVIILCTLDNAAKEIERCKFASPTDVLNSEKRIVIPPTFIWTEYEKFHKRWMEDKLYVDADVKMCGFKARMIVGDLFEAYRNEDKLIPQKYSKQCGEAYGALLSSGAEIKLMTVTNYIAGMSDNFAAERHKRLFMSSERASFV